MANILIFARELAPYCNSVGSTLRVITLANFLKKQGHSVTFIAAKGVFVSDFGLSEDIKSIDAIYLDDILQKYYTKKAVSNVDINKKNITVSGSLKNIIFEKVKNYSIPDIGIYFLPKFIKYCLRFIKDKEVDYLLISSPPHSSQILGLIVKLINKKIKLIVDYRDGWNTFGPFRPKNYLLLIISKFLEKNILIKCDYFTYQSAQVLEKIKKIYPLYSASIAKKSILVRNGYTVLDDKYGYPYNTKFDELVNIEKIKTIGYFGGLNFQNENFRNPIEFFQLLDSLNLDIVIKAYGVLYGGDKIPKFKNLKFEFLGVVPLLAAKELMKSCDALFVFHASNDDGDEVIPGKFYEYIEAQRPILVYGPKEMECGKIVADENFGIFIPLEYSDEDVLKIKKFILNGHILTNGSKRVKSYCRNEQYKKIQEVIFSEKNK